MLSVKDKSLQIKITAFVRRGWLKSFENGFVCWNDPKSNAFIKVSVDECPLCYKMDMQKQRH